MSVGMTCLGRTTRLTKSDCSSTWNVMGRAVGCKVGLQGCRGEPPRDSLEAAIGVRANLMPPGMRSAAPHALWSS